MKSNPAIVEALKRLDPAAPASPGQYVVRSWEGAPRGWDLPGRLVPLIESGHRFRAILHGCVGVGKSTEIARWDRELSSAGLVIALEHESPWNGTVSPDELAQAAFAAFREITGTTVESWSQLIAEAARPVIVFVDALDLLPAEQARLAFAPGTELCSSELPSIVYTAPHDVIMLQPANARDPRFDQVWHLPPFPVVQPDGSPAPATVAHLAAGLARRLEGLDLLDDPALLARIALRSAGIPRDAVRILRSAVLAAATTGRITAAHVLEGEREVRQDLEQALQDGDPSVLARVAETTHFRGDPRLVLSNAVVPYEGPERRYWRPHPLLLPLMEELRGGGMTA